MCSVGGHGIDPRRPPLVWEAWTPRGWEPCEVERDDTLGLNVSGRDRAARARRARRVSVVGGVDGGLDALPASVTAARRTAPSPLLVSGDRRDDRRRRGGDRTPSRSARGARHVRRHRGPAVLRPGLPPGRPGPRRTRWCSRSAVAGRSRRRDPAPERRWEEWTAVDDFGGQRADGPARHGGPDRPGRSGSGRRCAWRTAPCGGTARSPRGARRCGCAATGPAAAPAGNVAARTVSVLRSSIPYVAAVYNRRAAAGGVDGETVDEARTRGPLELRGRGRAVTVEDYVAVAHEAAPELARVHCVPVTDGPDAGAVRVLVVPGAPGAGRPHLAARPPAAGRRPRARPGARWTRRAWSGCA